MSVLYTLETSRKYGITLRLGPAETKVLVISESRSLFKKRITRALDDFSTTDRTIARVLSITFTRRNCVVDGRANEQLSPEWNFCDNY